MYNKKAMGSPSPLLNVVVTVPVDGNVKNMNAEPHAEWYLQSYFQTVHFTNL